jgi:lipocalin-like protein
MRPVMVAVALIAAMTLPAFAQDIRGVWKLVGVEISGGPDSGRHVDDVQPGLVIYTDKYYSGMAIESLSPRQRLRPGATEAERQDAWRPFVGNAGTYVHQDSILSTTPFVAKSPNAEGTTRRLHVRLLGDTLWTTIEEANGIVRRLRMTRVERYPSQPAQRGNH